MNARRLRGVFLNTVFSQSTQIFGQILLVPVFLHYWGSERYGHWLVLFAIPSAVALSDFGLGSAVANQLSLLSEQNRTGRLYLANGIWTLQSVANGVALAAVSLVVLTCPLGRWLALPESDRFIYRSATILLCLYSLFIAQAMTFNGIYRSINRYNLYLRYLGIARTAEVVITAVALMLGGKIVALALSYALLRGLTLAYLYFRLESEHRPCLSITSMRGLNRMVHLGIAFLAFPAGQALQNHLPVLVLNHLLGAGAVVVFATCRQVARVTTYAMSMINNSLWPEFSSLTGEGRKADAIKLHRLSISVAWMVCGLVVVILCLCGSWLMAFWTRGRVQVSSAEFACFAVPLLFNGIWSTSSVVLSATNNHSGLALRYFIGSVLAGGLCLLLVHLFGVVGAPFSLLILDIILITYVLPASCKVLGDPLSEVIKDILRMRELRRSAAHLLLG
jgi:O-antigen/teichoic acid export membrane protein